MAEKYKSWDKMMFTFTVPNTIRCKSRSVKNSKYTKMRELIKIKASLTKLLSRESGIKYFANIELGEKFSNPHLHLQIWCGPDNHGESIRTMANRLKQISISDTKDHGESINVSIDNSLDGPINLVHSQKRSNPTKSELDQSKSGPKISGPNTSSSVANLIRNKIISQYNLNSSLCHITLPEVDTDVYTYVVKDYSKFLSDDDIYNLDTQKKRYRSFLNKKIRFVSKSGDRYTKRAYKIAYWSYNVLRNKADLFLDKILKRFFFFNTKNLPSLRTFFYSQVKLCKEEPVIVIVFFMWSFDLIFLSPSNSPPLIPLLKLPRYDIII